MNLYKWYNDKIYLITKEKLDELLTKHANNEKFTCEEKQLFLYKDTSKDRYVAVCNISGDLFIEDFLYESDAIIWLLDLKEAEPLHAAEDKLDAWY